SPNVLVPALQRSVTPATAPGLLDYLAESIRVGWRPSETELGKLVKALPAEVQKKAGELHVLLRKSTEGQRTRLAALEPLLTGGVADAGGTRARDQQGRVPPSAGVSPEFEMKLTRARANEGLLVVAR